ncbi:glutathione S-transferase family protein [Marinimicrobium sp. ABcell2]|uniref:glutathione S-transferase family protein n=1 Tax=Marinimicrobium sp. ABcell2 TaxID=3069751 RepID=UPI0027B1C9D7|nr:glutathione S-transferase family protein [Marinimicrobium sp. ABcell2]MDQ2075752.1 glutathione S-transferase family protein [Marinimicrobium sp. ABcell2]
MSDITLYTHPYSRGRIARWMLEEVGVPYTVEVKEWAAMKAPEYLAINPMGKVPALTHGNLIVTEVAAICAYLADQFPEKGLAPAPGSPERGSYYRWLFFVAGPLEMATTAKAYDWRIDADNVTAVGCGYHADTVNTLESALKQSPYLCGDTFTTADLLAGSYIGWEMMQKNLEERPVFKDYVQRVESRPAARRANELDDALLEEPALNRPPKTG